MDTDSLYTPYKDEKYRLFFERISKDKRYPFAGIRIPILRKLAKGLDPDSIAIHYHEDVILRALAISSMKTTFEEKKVHIEKLLPYLSSWDHADVFSSALKVKEKDAAKEYFSALTKDERTFCKRLGIVFLLEHRNDYEDKNELLSTIVNADSAEYYISMAVAWALSLFYIEDKSSEVFFSRVSEATRKRAEQKIRDSRRC